MAANHTPRHDELLPAYALGALDGDDLRELEAHLFAGGSATATTAAAAVIACPVCRAELRQLASDLEGLALLAAWPLAGATPADTQPGAVPAAPAAPTTQVTAATPALPEVTATAPAASAGPAPAASLASALAATPAIPATPATPASTTMAPVPSAGDLAASLGDLRSRVLAQVAAEPRPLSFASAAVRRQQPVVAAGRPAGRSGALRFLQVAAGVLLVVGIWGIVRQANMGSEIERLRGERDQLALRASALEQRMAQVQAESERLASSISIVTAPGVQQVSLSGMGTAQKATGRTFVSEAEHKAVFYAYHLPPLAANKSYQLWVIDNDERKISVGVMQVDPRGEASVVVDKLLPVDNIQGWVVTVEPRGGVPQPTGPIALAG
jgi:Anti-sigma-K factor rskA